jgi:hypothetical protein
MMLGAVTKQRLVKTQLTEKTQCAIVNCKECELVSAVITFSYKLYGFNKSNYQSKPSV